MPPQSPPPPARSLALALALLTLNPGPGRAQVAPASAEISGTVTAQETGDPLPGVTVELVELSRRTTTASLGAYRFPALPPGVYTLYFRLGDVLARRATVRALPGQPITLDVRLETRSPSVLDEVVVTATRQADRSFDIPSPVNLIERDQIARQQAGKIGDLFAAQPGLEIEGAGPFLGRPAIRGLAGNRVLILVDGERLNNAREAINFGGVEPSLVEASEVERIEVTRGPASVLYGSDAIGGIVNLITRRPPAPAEGLVVGGSLTPRGSSADEQRSLAGELYLASPRLSLQVSASGRKAEDYDSPDGPVPNSGAETDNLNAKLRYRVGDRHSLLLDYQRFRGRDIGVPGTGGVFTGFFPFTRRDNLGLRYETRSPLPFLTTLQAGVYVQDQDENFSTVLDLPPINAGPFNLFIDNDTRRVSDVTTLGFDVQGTTLLGARQLLTYGVEFFRDDVDEDRREVSIRTLVPKTPGPPQQTFADTITAPTTPKSTFAGLGLYLQDDLDLGRVRLTPGLRYDRFEIETDRLIRPEGELPAADRSEDAVSASLGLLVRVTDVLHATASAGRAFRTPNIIERFFFGPGSQGGLTVPNPDLDNETSVNFDVGFKVQTRRFRASATYFRNHVDDLITFVPGTFMGDSVFAGRPITTLGNVARARIQGVEVEAEYTTRLLRSDWSLLGSLTYDRGDDLDADQPVFVPPLKGVLGLRWSDPGRRFAATVTSRLVADQDRVPAGVEPTDGFAVFNFYGEARLLRFNNRPATLRVGLENFTDRAYREPLNAALAPGVSLVSSLKVEF